MASSILTQTLGTLGATFAEIPKNLRSPALALLGVLTVIDLSLSVFNLEEQDWIKFIVKKTFKVGFLIWIIQDYPYLLDEIQKGFIFVGNKAIGMFDAQLISNPSKIIDIGFDLVKPIQEQAGVFTGTGLSFLILMIAFYFCILIMAFQIFITWLEYFALTGITVIFVPFGILNKTTFLFEKAISLLVSLGTKIMVLTLLLSASTKILLNLSVPPEPTLIQGLHILSVIASIAYLIWVTPSLASSLLYGNPSLSGNGALGTTLAATTTAASVGAIATQAAQGISNNAYDMGKEMTGGMKQGAAKGGEIGQSLGAVGGTYGQAIGKGVGMAAGAVVGGAYSGVAWSAKKGVGQSNNRTQRTTSIPQGKEEL